MTASPGLSSEYAIKSLPTIFLFAGATKVPFNGASRTPEALLDFYKASGGSMQTEARRLASADEATKALATGRWIAFAHGPKCAQNSACSARLAMAEALAVPAAAELRARVALLDTSVHQTALGDLGLSERTEGAFALGLSGTWAALAGSSPASIVAAARPHVQAVEDHRRTLRERAASVPPALFGRVHRVTSENMGALLGSGVPVLFLFTMDSSGPATSTLGVFKSLLTITDWRERRVLMAQVRVEESRDLLGPFGVTQVPQIRLFTPDNGFVYEYYDTCRSGRCFIDWVSGEYRSRNKGVKRSPIPPRFDLDWHDIDPSVRPKAATPLFMSDDTLSSFIEASAGKRRLLLIESGADCWACRTLREKLEEVAADSFMVPMGIDIGQFNEVNPRTAATLEIYEAPLLAIINEDDHLFWHRGAKTVQGMKDFVRNYASRPADMTNKPWLSMKEPTPRHEVEKIFGPPPPEVVAALSKVSDLDKVAVRAVSAANKPFPIGQVAPLEPADLSVTQGAILAMFFAPWCGHCKNLHPTWAQLAKSVSDNLVIGSLDCTIHTFYCSSIGVAGYPTIKLVTQTSMLDYDGPRTVEAFRNFAKNAGVPVGDSVASTASTSTVKATPGRVINLDDTTYAGFLANLKVPALVVLSAPWCGHCKRLDPILPELAAKMGEDALVAKIDATLSAAASSDFQVQGYPTLVRVSPGGQRTPYNGDRSLENMAEFLKQ